ncbi:hypothetical protein [Algibacter aquimarinus]|uniref:DUF4476 domain-containing protein n=1 Tax=Algibacter aquimarinus TaxID=1136748 RepID=A0ABP9HNI8_9FLAO
MLKKLPLLLCLCLVVNVFGQDKTREEIIQLMAEDTCECIKNDTASFRPDKSMSQKQVALGLCLLKSYNKRKAESETMKNDGMDDFEALGEEVGIQMVSVCGVEFMAIFSDEQLDEFIDESEEPEANIPLPPASKNEDDLQLEAQLTSLNNDVVSYFQVKDAFDKTHTFLIKEQFEGYKLLKKSNYNKIFNIYYKEINMFDLSESKYVKKKVVKYLESRD